MEKHLNTWKGRRNKSEQSKLLNIRGKRTKGGSLQKDTPKKRKPSK